MFENFDEPEELASGPRLNPKDINGHLLIVWAIDYVEHSPTKFSRPDKPSDVIIVDVVDLDLPDENGYSGLVARKCWWRQARLIQQLKSRIGQGPLLVRMGRGASSNGMEPPYELFTATQDPEALGRARGWGAAHPDHKPSSKTAPMPQAPSGPPAHWGAQEAQPDWSRPPQQQYPNALAQPYQASATQQAPPPPPAPPMPPAPPVASQEQRNTVLDRLRQQAQNQPTFQGTDPAAESIPF